MSALRFDLLFVLLACTWISGLSNPFDPGTASNPSCTPFKKLLTEWIITQSISYLADNPKNNKPPLNVQTVQPYTPSGLFQAYYGKNASAWEFQSAILDIVYASYKTPPQGKRIQMRKKMYKLAKAGSGKTARKVMGAILSDVITELSEDPELWKKVRCIAHDDVDNIRRAASVEFARLRNEVGDNLFGRFLEIEIGTTLAVVIDDTTSMTGEIEAAKQRVNIITDHVQNALDRPKDFVLVPFNDPMIGPLTVTSNATEFKEAVRRVHPRNRRNMDIPEMCMGGLKLAIEASRPGSTIYAITDAEAKDYKLQDSVIAEAKRKAIKIIFMLTNGLGRLDEGRQGQYYRSRSLYEYIASETGGEVLVVNKRSFFEATEIVQSRIKHGVVVLANQRTSRKSIDFYVDRSISVVDVEAKGSCKGLLVTSNQTKYMHNRLAKGVNTSSIPVSGMFGRWHLQTHEDENNCVVKLTAKSTLGFILTTFLKNSSNARIKSKMLIGNPSPNDRLRFVIDPYGFSKLSNLRIRFLDENGHDVMPERSRLVVETEGALGNIRPFRVVVEGSDSINGKFSRVVSSLLKPTKVTVTCNFNGVIFSPGIPTDVNITVHNYGKRESFLFRVSDEKNFASILHHPSRIIDQNMTNYFTIRLLAPENTKDGIASPVTVIACGSSSDAFQFDVCDAVVGLRKRPRIDSLRVKATVNSRFAETVVTSVVTNNADVGREAEFDVMLPVDAFITNLTMKLENETVVGTVNEKKKAKKIYDKAKKSGKAAGHVAARDSSTRVFKTSMFVEPMKNITFELAYQQLLPRIRGRYRYSLTLNPDQPVKHMRVDVFIEENIPFQFVTVPPFKTDQAYRIGEGEPPGTSVTISRNRKSAHVIYHPTINQQTQYSPLGLAGTFEVYYDLQRTNLFGDIAVANGYFAHFFSPPSLPNIPKIVVFLIDVSGSMLGYKMEQVQEALSAALRGLDENDYFNVVFMNHEAKPWINMIISSANSISVDDAISAVRSVEPSGGTDILRGFEKCFELFEPYLPEIQLEEEAGEESGEESDLTSQDVSEHYLRVRQMAAETRAPTDNYEKILVFLSDGKSNFGKTNSKTIVNEIVDMNQNRIRISTLGFGPLAEMKILKQIAGLNGGSSRRVFEELDAAAQIKDFFDDATKLLMTDVSIMYPLDRVEDLTNHNFETFHDGTEVVVAGRIRKDADMESSILMDEISARLQGQTFENNFEVDFVLNPMMSSANVIPSNHQVANFTEKLWAFLRVKDLLQKSALENNETIASQIEEEALNMSLKYNLVTPLTSMIVLREDEKKEIEEQLKKEKQEREKEEKRKEEERKKKLDEEEAKLDEKLLLSSSLATTTTSPSGGGFYGDPHFLIPILSDFYLCFDWNGENGEAYNLIHDDVTGLTVNGRLVTSSAPEGSTKSHRSYISYLAIMIPEIKFKLIISPFDITIVPVGAKNITLPVTSSLRFVRYGIVVKSYDVKRRSGRLEITLEGIVFHIIQRRTFGHPHQADHVDFYVSQYKIHSSSRISGVIGQFLHKKAKFIEGRDENEKILIVNGRSGRVSKFERQHPESGDNVTCWRSRNNARNIIFGDHDDYLVDDIIAAPAHSLL